MERETHEAQAESGQLIMELRIPARPDRLKLVRALIRTIARGYHCAAETADAMILAVDEACQNVIRHAYHEQEGDLIVTVRSEPGRLVYEIRDFAPRVFPGESNPRPLDKIQPGGLGTHFIHATMDEVCYGPAPDGGPGTLLRLVRTLN